MHCSTSSSISIQLSQQKRVNGKANFFQTFPNSFELVRTYFQSDKEVAERLANKRFHRPLC